MKKSVAFASVWLASTGLSIPLGAGGTSQPPAVTSDEQSGFNLLTGNTRVEFERLFGTEKARGKDDPSLPPAADSSAKLPWYPPTNDHRSCYGLSPEAKTIEQCLGTERYCQEELWGSFDDEKYGNSQECLAAREPRPSNQKPAATASTLSVPQATSSRWKEPDSSKCRDNKPGSEDCLGTQRYCELGASTVKDEAKREKAQKDCEASRGGRPSTAKPAATATTTTSGSSTSSVKLPWHEGTHRDCPMALGDEECEGTKSHCRQWFNKLGNKYQSPEECEAAREPQPQENK